VVFFAFLPTGGNARNARWVVSPNSHCVTHGGKMMMDATKKQSRKDKSMTEQQIQSQILMYLNSINAYPVKVISATHSGIPDIIACLNGNFIAIEVKTETGIVSKLQEYNLNQIKAAGGIAFVARSVEDVKKNLDAFCHYPTVVP